MIRVFQIIDPALRRRVIDALAHRQGVAPTDIPHWYEMDDATFSELLQELNEVEDVERIESADDSRE
jgi:hypothetical protein